MKSLNVIQPVGATQVNSSPFLNIFPVSLLGLRAVTHSEKLKHPQSSTSMTLFSLILLALQCSEVSLDHFNCIHLGYTHEHGQRREEKWNSWAHPRVDVYNHLHGHAFRKYIYWDFPGGPGAKIPCFQCRGPRSDPRSGNSVAQMVENLPGNAGDTGWIPRWGRSLGGGNGYLLQHSCLENRHG